MGSAVLTHSTFLTLCSNVADNLIKNVAHQHPFLILIHAFLGIVAHWWDLDDALKSALIALPKLLGVHSGENIAFTTVEVLKQYEIQNNVGYFTFDNASNNDTAIERINEILSNIAINREMSYEECRLRCAGHILNLVVKALLFRKDSDGCRRF